jgi:hypothetical protein
VSLFAFAPKCTNQYSSARESIALLIKSHVHPLYMLYIYYLMREEYH